MYNLQILSISNLLLRVKTFLTIAKIIIIIKNNWKFIHSFVRSFIHLIIHAIGDIFLEDLPLQDILFGIICTVVIIPGSMFSK